MPVIAITAFIVTVEIRNRPDAAGATSTAEALIYFQDNVGHAVSANSSWELTEIAQCGTLAKKRRT
jgi:hypothetical protein